MPRPLTSPKKALRAWVVDVSMGYGHQRTAYPLRDLAPDGVVLNANDYAGMPASDRSTWAEGRAFYEFVSKTERLPVLGRLIFGAFDRFQRIIDFYPRRSHSEPTLQLRQNFRLIRRGWGEDLIRRLAKNPLPLVTTFFTVAYMAEFFNYPGDIYCAVCDTDISRTWAPPDAAASRIRYFAPTAHAAERLARYGVRPENIFLTGYPLPKENLGSAKGTIARRDLAHRIANLDPRGVYRAGYGRVVRQYAGVIPRRADHPLTVMFAIGGAGAQRNIALAAAGAFEPKIRAQTIRFRIAVGSRKEPRDLVRAGLIKLGLEKNVELIGAKTTTEYFSAFNEALRETDILWTKPSELSFYAGLGIPIIIAPPLGSQEDFNKDWLMTIGAGMPQKDPRYVDQWLFDYLEAGWFAEAALQGFVGVEKAGAYHIEQIVKNHAP
ncbi:MAG: hypothetical protein AAB759_03140 [Patescibacteria group bacterium]